MIYIVAYVMIGLFTSIWSLFALKGEETPTVVTFGLVWPVVWAYALIQAIRGRFPPANCAWCGKTVAPMNGKLDAWREHYLDDCDKHPLAVRVKHYQDIIELDRKIIDNLTTELKPYREITKELKRRATEKIDAAILRGEG